MAVLLSTMLVLMVQCPAGRVIGMQRNGHGMPRRRSMMIRGRRRRIRTLTICCAVQCTTLQREGWEAMRLMREGLRLFRHCGKLWQRQRRGHFIFMKRGDQLLQTRRRLPVLMFWRRRSSARCEKSPTGTADIFAWG